MPTEPRPGTESPNTRGTEGQTGDAAGPRSGQRSDKHDRSGSARESDPAAGRDLPDENGEPPSVKRPGGNPEESEPPVENT